MLLVPPLSVRRDWLEVFQYTLSWETLKKNAIPEFTESSYQSMDQSRQSHTPAGLHVSCDDV